MTEEITDQGNLISDAVNYIGTLTCLTSLVLGAFLAFGTGSCIGKYEGRKNVYRSIIELRADLNQNGILEADELQDVYQRANIPHQPNTLGFNEWNIETYFQVAQSYIGPF